MAASSGLFLAINYNQSQLAERKHVARYWSIDTAVTAVPLSPHPSAITKLAAAILGGRLFGGGVLPAQYCPCGCIASPTLRTGATKLPLNNGPGKRVQLLVTAVHCQTVLKSYTLVHYGFDVPPRNCENPLPVDFQIFTNSRWWTAPKLDIFKSQ